MLGSEAGSSARGHTLGDYMLTWNYSKAFGLVAMLGVSWASLGGCSTKGDDEGGAAGDGSGPSSSTGICQSSCQKSCSGDTDCDTSNGELCCSLGTAGKICQPAAACPRFCSADSKCDTKSGEACLPVDLSYPDVCVEPRLALEFCSDDD